MATTRATSNRWRHDSQSADHCVSLILTTEAIVAEIPEPKAPAAPHHDEGGFGGGF